MGPGKISGVSDLSVSLLSETVLGSPHHMPNVCSVEVVERIKTEKEMEKTEIKGM